VRGEGGSGEKKNGKNEEMPIMKACIIVPPSEFLDDDKVFPALGPWYIKRYVEENSMHQIDVLTNPPFNNLERYDVVGFSVTTPQFNYVDKVLKDLPKDMITVLGGPHCRTYSVEPGTFTYVVREDGCKPFLNILNGNDPGKESDDNDQLPYRDMTYHEYKYVLDGRKSTNVITSRGCPLLCSFCEHARTPGRFKSKEAVRKEIQECVNLGFEGVMFFDDLFCLNTMRVKDMCEVIKPFNIKFRCFAHALSFNREMAQYLAEAGCVEIGYGAEHASQKILDNVNKKTKAIQNYQLINTAHEFGLRVKAFLMIGLPGEDHETVKELEQFVLTSDVDDFDLCVYYPFVGTEIADYPEKFDIQIEDDKSGAYYKGKLGSSSVIVRTEALSSDDIKYWQKRIYSHNKRWKGNMKSNLGIKIVDDNNAIDVCSSSNVNGLPVS
jgi:radical SAM superfamily enzyme YgiQ (UPF0313 family)